MSNCVENNSLKLRFVLEKCLKNMISGPYEITRLTDQSCASYFCPSRDKTSRGVHAGCIGLCKH